MRFVLAILMGVALTACGSSSPAPVAQASSQAGGSAVGTVNNIRAGAKVSPIRRSAVLDRVAKAHAKDMAANNFFGHTGSNGSTVATRTKAAGYNWCTVSENVAKGYRDQAGAIESWRVSPGHYRNLVNRKSREFGLARSGNYWVMVLAAKRC